MTEVGFESRIPDPTMLSWLKRRIRGDHRWLSVSMELKGRDGSRSQ